MTLYSKRNNDQQRKLPDSDRARTRITSIFHDYESFASDIARAVQERLGRQVQRNYYDGKPVFALFFKKAEIRDVLDTITLVFERLSQYQARVAAGWVIPSPINQNRCA